MTPFEVVTPTTLLHLTAEQAEGFRWREQRYGRNHPFLEVGNQKTGAYYLIDAAQQYAVAPYSKYWIARQGYLTSLGCRLPWDEQKTKHFEKAFSDVLWNAGHGCALIALPAERVVERLGSGYCVSEADHPLQDVLRRMDASVERIRREHGPDNIFADNLEQKRRAIAAGAIHRPYQMGDVLAGAMGFLFPQINTNTRGERIPPRDDNGRSLYVEAGGDPFRFAEADKFINFVEDLTEQEVMKIRPKQAEKKQPRKRRRFPRADQKLLQEAEEQRSFVHLVEDTRRFLSFLKDYDTAHQTQLLGALYWFLLYEDPEKQASCLDVSVAVFEQYLSRLDEICEEIEIDRSFRDQTWWSMLRAEAGHFYDGYERETREQFFERCQAEQRAMAAVRNT